MAVPQGRSERRGEEVPTALGVTVRPYNGSWRMENTLQYFRASERCENDAGGLFQHPAKRPEPCEPIGQASSVV
jgi:hypothetical protein